MHPPLGLLCPRGLLLAPLRWLMLPQDTFLTEDAPQSSPWVRLSPGT